MVWMNLTMQLKFLPSPEQSDALLRTMERFNAACDALAAVAFANRCANKVELQKLAYHDIRRDLGLGAQMTVRAIAKVVEVYKRDKDIQPTFRPHGAIVYDQRILSWKGADRVSGAILQRAIKPLHCDLRRAVRQTCQPKVILQQLRQTRRHFGVEHELAFGLIPLGILGNEQVPHRAALSADTRHGLQSGAGEPALASLHHRDDHANNSRNRSLPC